MNLTMNSAMKKEVFIGVLLFCVVGASVVGVSVVCVASGGQEGDHGGVPRIVFWQAVNFTLFVGLLYFVLKKKVVAHFASRKDDFLEAVNKAQSVKQSAEQKHQEISHRLNRLKEEEVHNSKRAQQEAEALRKEILREADVQAKVFKEEALHMVKMEKLRAASEVRTEMITRSMEEARKLLGERIEGSDQTRLQDNFVEKIQVVRS